MTDVLAGLLAAIRTEADDSTIRWSRDPTPLSGGFWAQMWQVELTGGSEDLAGSMVARVMPDPEVAARETAIQAHLAATGFPTPTVRLAAGPGPDLDQAWMLMDLAPGRPLLDDLSGASAAARLPRLARSLPDRLATHTAALHAIDPGALPETTTIGTYLAGLEGGARDLGRDDLAAVADWLAEHRPPGGRTVVCHGDLHPFNTLTDPSGDTVLDWSAARTTDPAYDIAYTTLLLTHPPLTAPRLLAPVLNAAGRSIARRFRRTYDRVADRPIDPEQLDWFTSFHSLRVVFEVASLLAGDGLDRHAGHPLIGLAPVLAAELTTKTTVGVTAH